MGADAGSAPIRGGDGVNPRWALLGDAADEFVYQVGMRAMMAATLLEGAMRVRFVIDTALCEARDLRGE